MKPKLFMVTIWKDFEFVGSWNGPLLAAVQWAKAQQARGRDYSAVIAPMGVEI
jgi:hypothetical protein